MFYFPSLLLFQAQVPDNDEQFVPDFQTENCEYAFLCALSFVSTGVRVFALEYLSV